MTKVLLKHDWTCPKCGEKVKFGELVNRDNVAFYFRLSLMCGASILIGCITTLTILALL